MTLPGSIGRTAGAADDDTPRKLRDLQRQVAELITARSLQAASVGAGGIIIMDDGDLKVIGTAGGVASLASGDFKIFGVLQSGLPRLQLSTSDAAQDSGIVAVLPGSPTPTLYVKGPSTEGQDDSSAVSLTGAKVTSTCIGTTGHLASLALDGEAGTAVLSSAGVALDLDVNGMLNLGACKWDAVTAAEWRAQASGTSTYIPVRASSFPTSSSEAVKEDVSELPFDAVDAVKQAPARRWRYKPDHAADQNHHVSPMAEDLPAELVLQDGDDKSVDSRDLIGVLWAAVGQLAARVEALESR